MTELLCFIAGGIGGFLVWLLNMLFAPRHRILELRLDKVEVDLEAHCDADRSGEIWTELRGMSGNIEKLLSQNTALLVASESQRQQIITLFNNQTDMKSELRDCKKEHR